MKRSINLEIGEGLFSSDPIPVEIEFADHTATFHMKALTQADIADFEKDGVKFDAATVANALDLSRKMLERIVLGWDGLMAASGTEIKYNEVNRNRLAEVPDIASELMTAALSLATRRSQVEEGNSASSSAGTSEAATGKN